MSKDAPSSTQKPPPEGPVAKLEAAFEDFCASIDISNLPDPPTVGTTWPEQTIYLYEVMQALADIPSGQSGTDSHAIAKIIKRLNQTLQSAQHWQHTERSHARSEASGETRDDLEKQQQPVKPNYLGIWKQAIGSQQNSISNGNKPPYVVGKKTWAFAFMQATVLPAIGRVTTPPSGAIGYDLQLYKRITEGLVAAGLSDAHATFLGYSEKEQQRMKCGFKIQGLSDLDPLSFDTYVTDWHSGVLTQ